MVTAVLVGAFWLVVATAGVLVADLLRVDLRIEERLAVAAVSGLVLGAAASLLLALGFGFGPVAWFGGPGLVAAAAAAATSALGRPLTSWRQSLGEVPQRWRTGELWRITLVVAVAVVGWSWALAHGLFEEHGALWAGYPTTWADWSLHATVASNFALGDNLPPQVPIFSGTPDRYPFLPDFQSATLLGLGASLPAALAAPQAVLCIAATILVVSLAVRLAGSLAVGVVAMAIVVLGGGLGFTGLWWDACAAGHLPADHCSISGALAHPGDGLATLGRSLRLVADQPRAYDGLVTPDAQRPLGSAQQWYTPLLAWWLPQRTFVYGFTVVLSVLLLLEVALARRGPPLWGLFAVCGVLVGLLPLLHPHSLVLLALVLPLLAVGRWRREWLLLLVVAVAVAAPRLAQIAAGGHGGRSSGVDTTFPYFEPGWLWNSDPRFAHVDVSFSALPSVLGRTLQVAVTPSFWGFWLLNTGVLVPVCLLVVLGALLRVEERGVLRSLGMQIGAPIPGPLLRFCLPFLVVFPVANVVVTQPWDWDNTKLLVAWQFAAALLTAAWAVHWWRRGGGRRLAAAAATTTTLATGVLVVLRLLPWTPASDAPGPYVWASSSDRQLARLVAERTRPDAVFLTGGAPTDPILTLAGRRALVGYPGWLFSYGIDYGPRLADVATMLAGCPATPDADCPVFGLLRRYGVTDVRIGPTELSQFHANDGWWSAHFPVVVRVGDVSVYAVE